MSLFKQALAHFDDVHLTVIAMVIFLSVYVIMAARAFWIQDNQETSRIANLPLQNEEELR